ATTPEGRLRRIPPNAQVSAVTCSLPGSAVARPTTRPGRRPRSAAAIRTTRPASSHRSSVAAGSPEPPPTPALTSHTASSRRASEPHLRLRAARANYARAAARRSFLVQGDAAGADLLGEVLWRVTCSGRIADQRCRLVLGQWPGADVTEPLPGGFDAPQLGHRGRAGERRRATPAEARHRGV